MPRYRSPAPDVPTLGVSALGLEGVVSKRPAAPYRPGRSRRRLRLKTEPGT